MQYLHTMVRIRDIDASLDFYCNRLGLKETRRYESKQGRFTLVFLAAPDDEGRAKSEQAPLLELTYNWDPEEYTGGRNFGHLAFRVDDIYERKIRRSTVSRQASGRSCGLPSLLFTRQCGSTTGERGV